MNKSRIRILIATHCMLAWIALADDTNVLKTTLGVFETRTDTILIKGFGTAGSMSVGPVVISVRYKDSTDTTSGEKADGLAIDIDHNTLIRKRILVDYDEIDSLLNSMNYLNKLNYDVTKLPGFEVCFSTKAGLRVVANSDRRDGAIQEALEYGDDPRIPLTTLQMTQLYGFIDSARKNLDAVRSAK